MRNHHALAGRLLPREYDYVRFATDPRVARRFAIDPACPSTQRPQN
jgi:hypothetical protein